MPFAATWMDLETVILSEVRERQIYDIAYIWSLKKWYKWTYVQNKNRVTDVENTYGYPGGKGRGGINWKTGIDTYTLLHIKQMTNKDLLYSTGNSTQYSVMACMGKESKKKSGYMCMYNWFTLLYTWN